MIKLANKFALLVASITFIMCMLGGISVFTSALRSTIVFIGVLFTFFIAGQALRFGLIMLTPPPSPEGEEES
jgi:hypothetical protein